MHGPSGGIGPHNHRQGSQGQLQQHTGHTNNSSMPFIWKCPGTGGVHIGQWKEDQEHHAHGMYLSPVFIQLTELFTGEGMTELMADLKHHKG